MKCKECNKELEKVETLFELDSENQRLISYYLCPECHSIYNTSGELVIPSPHLEKSLN